MWWGRRKEFVIVQSTTMINSYARLGSGRSSRDPGRLKEVMVGIYVNAAITRRVSASGSTLPDQATLLNQASSMQVFHRSSSVMSNSHHPSNRLNTKSSQNMFFVNSTKVMTPPGRSRRRNVRTESVKFRVACTQLLDAMTSKEPTCSGCGSFSMSRRRDYISGAPENMLCFASATSDARRSVKTYSKGAPCRARWWIRYLVVPAVPAPTSKMPNLRPGSR